MALLPFLETPRFNTEIRYGTRGGPNFSTDITPAYSGYEQRNVNWLDAKGSWQLGGDLYTKKEIDALIAFFRERKGRLGGFRFKDWSDWYATADEGAFIPIDGNPSAMQMVKRYRVGNSLIDRAISKPVYGSLRIFKNGVPVTAAPIDYTTGLMVLTGIGYTWSGQFDVPVRFDVDKFNASFEAYRDTDGESLFAVSGLSVSELPFRASFIVSTTLTPPPFLPTPGDGSTGLPASFIPRRIEYYGDGTIVGILQGGGTAAPTPVQTFATALPSQPPYAVINNGVEAMSTGDALAGGLVTPAWSLRMAQSTADIVILNYGLQDIQDGTTIPQFQANIRQLVTVARAAGKTVIWESFNPDMAGASIDVIYLNAIKAVAADISLFLIDQYGYLVQYMADNNLTNTDIAPDGIHPIQLIYDLKGEYAAQQFQNLTIPTAPPVPSDTTPGTDPGTSAGTGPFGQIAANYDLTFSDEFDGTALAAHWNTHYWYDTEPAVQNYAVSGGSLKIWPDTGFVGRVINTDPEINSQGFSQAYGFWECEAKLPVGKGCWASFWGLNHDTDARPTLNVFQAYSGGSDGGWATPALHPDNYGAEAWDDYPFSQAGVNQLTDALAAVDLSAGFHKYGMKRTPTSVSFYFDGVQIGPVIPYNQTVPMFILLSLLFGGASGVPNTTDTPMGDTNAFEIHYVRVWRFV